jgi:hypothetical protein
MLYKNLQISYGNQRNFVEQFIYTHGIRFRPGISTQNLFKNQPKNQPKTNPKSTLGCIDLKSPLL